MIGRAAGLSVAVTVGLAALSTPAVAEELVTLTFRGGTYDRDDDGYADHASTFGLDGAEVGGGGVIEGGFRVLPRLWLYASWSGFTSLAQRRLGELRVSNQALLLQAGLTVFRRDDVLAAALPEPLSIRIDVLAGGGLYWMSDELDGASQSARGPGVRAGSQLTMSWRSFGFIVAYGLHLARPSLEDRLDGELGAGGNEFGAGLALRF